MLEFKRTGIEADIYGTVYTLRRPKYGEAREYARKVKDQDDETVNDEVMALLDRCGLPREVCEDMESQHLEALLRELMPDSKK